MPAISVILPIFNAAQTLPQALDSLLRQRLRDFEIIAIDDGSTDATPDILARYAQHDRRVRVVSPGRRGLIDALNLGIAHAQAPFLARMDADDVSHPDRLGRQVAYFQQHPDIAVVSCLIQCFPRPQVAEGFRLYEAWLNSLQTPEDIARDIFIESPLVHPSVMLRRACLETSGGYCDFGWAEDYDLWLRLHHAEYRFAKVPRILHFWRESLDRLTRKDGRYSVENFLRAKAHYLRQGPLKRDPRAIIWGSGQMGRRLSKHLLREGVDLIAFVDIDPKKIGNTRRGAPIIAPENLPGIWQSSHHPPILAAVPSRGARSLIRQRLHALGMVETRDFFCVA